MEKYSSANGIVSIGRRGIFSFYWGDVMIPDILLIRHDDGYRILHGRLHLANLMRVAEEVVVDASGEGKVKIIKTASGAQIENDHVRLPLLND